MGLLMTAFNQVHANDFANCGCYMKRKIFNLQTACEHVGVYDQEGILKTSGYDMNEERCLSIMDADERAFSHPIGLLSLTFYFPIILLALAFWRRLSYSKKRSGYRRYGRHIWTRRTVFWRQKNISRAKYIVFARQSRLQRSTETVGFFGQLEKGEKFFSTMVLGEEEDNCNVVTALRIIANPITSPSLQKPTKLINLNRLVDQEQKYQKVTEKPLPFIFNRKLTKKRIRFVRKCGNSSMSSPLKRRKPQNDISRRRKKRIHETGQQIVKREVVQEREKKIPTYPEYHHSNQQVLNLYKSIRKGSVFWPSKKVLWRNRHRLHDMARNRLRNVSLSELYGACEREKEYAGNEPPEDDDVSSGAELNSVTLTMGLGYSSDVSGDGPKQHKKTNSYRNVAYTTDASKSEKVFVFAISKPLLMGPEFSSDTSVDGLINIAM